MNTQEFVDAVQELIIDKAAEMEAAIFLNPPGRKPDAKLLELSRWYKGLSESDRDMARKAMAKAARDAIFGIFVGLDGSMRLTNEEGHFELRFVRGEQFDLICHPEEMIHELLP